jgi:hypothetical protein
MSNEVDSLKARLDFIHNRCVDIKIVLDELKDRILQVDDEEFDPINRALVYDALQSVNRIKGEASYWESEASYMLEA